MSSTRQWITAAAAMGTLLTLAACEQERTSGPSPARITPEAVAYARAARARTAWVSEIHNAAMRDWMDNHRAFGAGRNNANLCTALVRMTEKYVPQLEAHAGDSGDDPHAVAARAVHGTEGCGGTPLLSVFDLRARPLLAMVAMQSDGDTPTGEYEAYVGGLQAAVDNASDASSADAALTNVLAGATSLPPADFNVLASMANLAAGSSYYWYDVESSGQWGGGGGGGGELQVYSMFMMARWKIVASADLFGCAAGAADKLWLSAGGAPGWGIIAGACGIWGVAGSGAAYFAT